MGPPGHVQHQWFERENVHREPRTDELGEGQQACCGECLSCRQIGRSKQKDCPMIRETLGTAHTGNVAYQDADEDGES